MHGCFRCSVFGDDLNFNSGLTTELTGILPQRKGGMCVLFLFLLYYIRWFHCTELCYVFYSIPYLLYTALEDCYRVYIAKRK